MTSQFHYITWIAAAGAAISSLYGGMTFIDDRYARAPQVQLLELRVEEKILTDRVSAIQHRLWKIEDEYGANLTGAPVTVKEEYRHMVHDREQIKDQIQSIMDSYRRNGYNASDTYYSYERPVR
jgi:hypothetical protein